MTDAAPADVAGMTAGAAATLGATPEAGMTADETATLEAVLITNRNNDLQTKREKNPNFLSFFIRRIVFAIHSAEFSLRNFLAVLLER